MTIFKETFRSWSEDKAPRLAAALAYYTIFSIAPLLVLVIAITGFVVGSNAAIRGQILSEVEALVGQQGAEMVNTLITNTSRPRDGIIATVIGIATLIFGATGVYVQLKDALNTIWEVQPKKQGGVRGMFSERLSGLVMILGLGFLLLVSLVVSTAVSAVSQYLADQLGGVEAVPILLNYGIQLIVITVIFGAILKEVPDVELGWRDVFVGALVTAILFLVGQYLISLYFSKASPASAYGAAGSLVVLLLWLYYSAQILFLGAEFTKAYSHSRARKIIPTENAERMTDADRAQQGIPRAKRVEREERVPEFRPLGAQQSAPIPVSGEEVDEKQQPAEVELHPADATEQSPSEEVRRVKPERPADTGHTVDDLLYTDDSARRNRQAWTFDAPEQEHPEERKDRERRLDGDAEEFHRD